MGVGLLFSRSATAAWKAAGSEMHTDLGPRVIAAPLLLRDSRSRERLGLYVVSGYAPSLTRRSVTDLDTYYANINQAIARKPSGYVLILLTDANASLGKGNPGRDREPARRAGALGQHGIAHVNAAGHRLRTFLETHELAALTSFFRKPHYDTWIHPRSKLGHQLDHILVSRRDLRRFTDASACCGQLIDSDHRAFGCRLRVEVYMERKPVQVRSKLTRLDIAGHLTPGSERERVCRQCRATGARPTRSERQCISAGIAGSGGERHGATRYQRCGCCGARLRAHVSCCS